MALYDLENSIKTWERKVEIAEVQKDQLFLSLEQGMGCTCVLAYRQLGFDFQRVHICTYSLCKGPFCFVETSTKGNFSCGFHYCIIE